MRNSILSEIFLRLALRVLTTEKKFLHCGIWNLESRIERCDERVKSTVKEYRIIESSDAKNCKLWALTFSEKDK